jgi:hypothetical protein
MKNIKGFFQYITENLDIKTKVNAVIDELISIGYINPFNPREIILHDQVGVEVSYFDGGLWLSSIQSYEKGAGAGAKAMKTILAAAAKYDVVIQLSPKPFGQKEMNKTELKKWYKRLGFKSVRGGDRMMWKPLQNSEMDKHNITPQDIAVFKELFEMESDPMYRAWVTPTHVHSLNKLYKSGAIAKGVLDNKIMFYVDNTIDNHKLALELLRVADVDNTDSHFYDVMYKNFVKYADKNNI